jgi:hypothetical protein
MAVFVAMAVIGAIAKLFVCNVIFFEGILFGITADIAAQKLLGFHPVFALLAGAGLFVVLTLIQGTRVGFWIVCAIMSAVWGYLAAAVGYLVFGEDIIWIVFLFAAGAALSVGLHVSARKKIFA